jgi:chorismate-pyruvate lyase
MTDVPPSTAAGLTAILRRSGGTVTEFLEDLAGEPIDADILVHRVVPAGDGNALGLIPDAELLRRAVLLTGRATGRVFVYAESAIAAGRLPAPVRQRLERSRDPIGRVLLDHRLTVRREPVAGPVVAETVDEETGALLRRAPLSRRYRIMIGSDPAFVVSEWFLEAVPEALAARPRWSEGPNHEAGL